MSRLSSTIKHVVPRSVIRRALPLFLRKEARQQGLDMRVSGDRIDVRKGSTVLRVSADHAVYLRDIITSFDYYSGGVVPFTLHGLRIIDFSTPRYHDVVGFDAFPILFPSFAEPLVTTNQYLEFAGLSQGMTVLDLGAYSGLTSILFSRAVGRTGTVVAVDADDANVNCIKRNLANYSKHWDGKIFLLEGAVWDSDEGLRFSSEGNMGSSAAAIVGSNRGSVRSVPSFTLSTIAQRFNLARVDFIKCDVEGAERVIFKDHDFFQRFAPKIVIESHVIDGVETTAECIAHLEGYGYRCVPVVQHGVPLPLIRCQPLSVRPKSQPEP